MSDNTQDLSKFGYRELEEARDLLTAYLDNNWYSDKDAIGDEVRIEFNPMSGHVFLVDEDYQVAILSGGGDKRPLENWLNCSSCGTEGIRSEVEFHDDYNCKECHRKEVEEK